MPSAHPFSLWATCFVLYLIPVIYHFRVKQAGKALESAKSRFKSSLCHFYLYDPAKLLNFHNLHFPISIMDYGNLTCRQQAHSGCLPKSSSHPLLTISPYDSHILQLLKFQTLPSHETPLPTHPQSIGFNSSSKYLQPWLSLNIVVLNLLEILHVFMKLLWPRSLSL